MTRRGQTTIDFAVGASIFLLSVAFILAFVPGMLEPFGTSLQEETVSADRIATQISNDLLTAGDRPHLLDRTCTVAFFDSAADDSACAFDNTQTLGDRFGLESRQHLNVQIVGQDTDGDGTPERLCADADGHVDEETQVGTCASPFEVGETVPNETGSVVVARRAVSVDGVRGTLLVRMW
ncbi:hypothetical protein [Salinigranum sp.]|uniref:DUF7287 family protein n=1 Tax=Salinigranum sp. TaxID=1966351 RepID=UPI0035635B45